jgi:hypothetical protein
VDRDEKLIFEKKAELISRRCHCEGADITAGAAVSGAIVEEPMPLDKTSKN